MGRAAWGVGQLSTINSWAMLRNLGVGESCAGSFYVWPPFLVFDSLISRTAKVKKAIEFSKQVGKQKR